MGYWCWSKADIFNSNFGYWHKINAMGSECWYVRILMLIQHQNGDWCCTNIGPMSKMMLGQRYIVILNRQIHDVIPILDQTTNGCYLG